MYDLRVLEEACWIGGLSGDAVLDAVLLHTFEVRLTAKEVGTLTGGVLGHLSSAVLAPHLCQFLDLSQYEFSLPTLRVVMLLTWPLSGSCAIMVHAECVSVSPGALLYPPEPGPPMMDAIVARWFDQQLKGF